MGPAGGYSSLSARSWPITGDPTNSARSSLPEPEGAPAERGLWLVELTQGEIIAEVLPEFQIQWVRPAPDGSLYVFGTTDQLVAPHEVRPTSPSTLWRLDALTRATSAQREFTGYQSGWLILAQPSKRAVDISLSRDYLSMR